mmetsp:Transcript_139501/g.446346  ORF Transcript_139501/g.446346 Transcript_139501/m.446346 type:complete len:232 (+) Transcript_139501:735-1430(+)
MEEWCACCRSKQEAEFLWGTSSATARQPSAVPAQVSSSDPRTPAPDRRPTALPRKVHRRVPGLSPPPRQPPWRGSWPRLKTRTRPPWPRRERPWRCRPPEQPRHRPPSWLWPSLARRPAPPIRPPPWPWPRSAVSAPRAPWLEVASPTPSSGRRPRAYGAPWRARRASAPRPCRPCPPWPSRCGRFLWQRQEVLKQRASLAVFSRDRSCQIQTPRMPVDLVGLTTISTRGA